MYCASGLGVLGMDDGKRKAERQPRPEEDIKPTRDLPDEPDLLQGWVLILIQSTAFCI